MSHSWIPKIWLIQRLVAYHIGLQAVLPSGKHTKNMENHHGQWENSLCQSHHWRWRWRERTGKLIIYISVAIFKSAKLLVITRGYKPLSSHSSSHSSFHYHPTMNHYHYSTLLSAINPLVTTITKLPSMTINPLSSWPCTAFGAQVGLAGERGASHRVAAREGRHAAVACRAMRGQRRPRGSRCWWMGLKFYGIWWLVGGLDHFLFFHILGIIIPID